MIIFSNHHFPIPYKRKRAAVSPSATKGLGAVVLNAKLPWPTTIELPTNFRLDLARVLQEKEEGKMSRKLRKAFVARIFEHFSRYTL